MGIFPPDKMIRGFTDLPQGGAGVIHKSFICQHDLLLRRTTHPERVSRGAPRAGSPHRPASRGRPENEANSVKRSEQRAVNKCPAQSGAPPVNLKTLVLLECLYLFFIDLKLE